MNYVWDLMIKSEQAGIASKDISFVPAKVFSPYMELCRENLNSTAIESRVEINAFYRFQDIFHALLDNNHSSDEELKNELFNLSMHLLAEIDRMQGMDKWGFYAAFTVRDLLAGVMGEQIKHGISLYAKEEREQIAIGLMKSYVTGEPLHWLREAVKYAYPQSSIYVTADEKDELLIYIGAEDNERNRCKIQTLLDLFAPVRYESYIYWETHFGIIGLDATMKIGQTALY